eukprot:1259681-Rhodomonas_salina.2
MMPLVPHASTVPSILCEHGKGRAMKEKQHLARCGCRVLSGPSVAPHPPARACSLRKVAAWSRYGAEGKQGTGRGGVQEQRMKSESKHSTLEEPMQIGGREGGE